jgi:hypothetical protein
MRKLNLLNSFSSLYRLSRYSDRPEKKVGELGMGRPSLKGRICFFAAGGTYEVEAAAYALVAIFEP